jgi:hypothetical protein
MAKLESSDTKFQSSNVSRGVRIAGTFLRTIFICALTLLMWRISLPQSETIWTAYDTPIDLVRLAVGFVVCIWLVVQLFRGPGDAQGYRTWLYLGLVAIPFTLICLIAIW